MCAWTQRIHFDLKANASAARFDYTELDGFLYGRLLKQNDSLRRLYIQDADKWMLAEITVTSKIITAFKAEQIKNILTHKHLSENADEKKIAWRREMKCY